MKREWLIKLRQTKQLTQQQVSERCFIDRSFYSQIESGKRNPSANVAKRIASELGFNPLTFYKNEFELPLNEGFLFDSNLTIPSFFKNINDGKILYMYNSPALYFQNTYSFILTAIEKENHCFIVDQTENIDRLKDLLTDSFINDYAKFIHLINDKDFSLGKLKDVIWQMSIENSSLYLWENHEKDIASSEKASRLLDVIEDSYDYKTIYVCSFNSSLITAGSHLQKMKEFPTIMTDDEVVDSPLYKNNNKIHPSLHQQEDI